SARTQTWKPGEIGDATNIEQQPVLFHRGTQQQVAIQRKRGTLPSSSDVFLSKVTHGKNASPGCHKITVPQLQSSGPGRNIGKSPVVGVVVDGLPMAGDEVNITGRTIPHFQCFQDLLGVHVCDIRVQISQLDGWCFCMSEYATNFFLILFGMWDGCKFQQLEFGLKPAPRYST